MIRAKSVDAPQGRLPKPAFLAAGTAARVLAALPWSRAVGGCVRDAIAGQVVHDIDIAAPLPPEEIIRALTAAGLKVFETGLAHGTVTAVLDHDAVEVTALRRDVATDGRHATVAWTTEWQEDAARRDFTINAMSCDADGRLWDYFGGREDLAAGRVVFVGDPATRLAEDYLRALRFFRFWARFGQGQPDRAALAAIRAAVPGLRSRIAAERIWMELKRLLDAPDPVGALALMRDGGLLRAVLPEAEDFRALGRLVSRRAPRDALLRLAALLPPGAAHQALAARLKLSGEEAARLSFLLGTKAPDEAGLRRFLAAAQDNAAAVDVLWLAEARDAQDRAALREAAATAPVPVFPLQGRDALALGAAPGPAVGQVLREVEAWWLEGDCMAPREAALEELGRRLAVAHSPLPLMGERDG
jgi:poly(A) polymerase/tRNA nucleotidyltransferase (CCA-adding enzyme)